ncbi:MAG: hypothetical protein HQL74_10030 [Magnetococcales bacterium]|nr:hypothetical protein [Magnetococcales bacterium]
MAETADQGAIGLPPSPVTAMNVALQKGSDALAQARTLDTQRKTAWIAAQDAIRLARKESAQHQQAGETAWANSSMSYEDMEEALIKEESSNKRATSLEQQARVQQEKDRMQIKQLMGQADQAERTAQSIHQAWIENYGRQALETARNYRQQLEHVSEFGRLRILDVQNNLERTKNELQKAVQELEQWRLEQKAQSDALEKERRADQQKIAVEEQRADAFWSSSTDSHEDLLDSMKLKDGLSEKTAATARKKTSLDLAYQAKFATLSAKCERLTGELKVLEDRLKTMRDQSDVLLQQAHNQSQYADSLARLVDPNWPSANTGTPLSPAN